MEEDYDWLYEMSNEFRNNYIIRSTLTRRFHTLAEQESRGDYQKYAQFIVGPGKMFDHGEFGSSIRLQGLAGSAELERIRMEIANLPPLPRPSMKKPQTGGRKRKATKKARRKNRRLSRRNK